jgi:hypothetical protein
MREGPDVAPGPSPLVSLRRLPGPPRALEPVGSDLPGKAPRAAQSASARQARLRAATAARELAVGGSPGDASAAARAPSRTDAQVRDHDLGRSGARRGRGGPRAAVCTTPRRREQLAVGLGPMAERVGGSGAPSPSAATARERTRAPATGPLQHGPRRRPTRRRPSSSRSDRRRARARGGGSAPPPRSGPRPRHEPPPRADAQRGDVGGAGASSGSQASRVRWRPCAVGVPHRRQGEPRALSAPPAQDEGFTRPARAPAQPVEPARQRGRVKRSRASSDRWWCAREGHGVNHTAW